MRGAMCCRSARGSLTHGEPQCFTVQSPLDPELSYPSKAQVEVQGPQSVEELVVILCPGPVWGDI